MAELTPYSFMADVRYALVFVLSYVTLLAERLWNSFWPAVSVAAFYAGIAALGIVRAFPPVAHAVLLFVLTTAFALAALHLGDKFRWPRGRDVRRVVEKQSGLRHRPLETALDKPIDGLSSASRELWESFQKRVQLLRGRTLPYRPHSTAAARDPWSLRHAALLLLVVGLVVAQGDAWTRIRNGMFVDVRQWIHTQPAALEAWITPPEYTNLTPVFLAVTQTGAEVEKGAISVPAGSVLKVRISGHAEPPKLTYGEAKEPVAFTEAAKKSYTLEMPLMATGVLKIKQGWFRKLGEWPVTVTPDAPPEISIIETTEGERNALKIHYRAKDDYGVTETFGTITAGKALRDAFNAQPVTFDLPPPSPDKEDLSESIDLTGHPWAGSKVTLTLTADDAALHSVESQPKELYLPERKFESAVARALVHERKRLVWYNNGLTQRIVVGRLADIAVYPDNYKRDKIIFLGLNMAIKRLMYDGDDESVQSVIGLLWDLAVRAEDGGLSFAQRELSEALQRLSEALKDKDLTKEELQRLQEEVAQKMREYMATMASEMQQRMQEGEKMKPISPELAKKLMERIDMQKIMEQMKELTQGSERERMQKMADFLKKTVDNTDMNRMQQMQKQQQKAMEALDDLQKLIERQQNLLDKTNRMKPEENLQQQREQEQQQKQQQQDKQGDSGQQGQQNQQQQSGGQQQSSQQQGGGQQQQQQSGGQQQDSQQQGGQQQQQQAGQQGQSAFPPMPQADGSQGGQQQGQSQQQARGESGQQGEQGQQGQGQQGQQGQGQQGQQSQGAQGQPGQQGQGQQAGNTGQQGQQQPGDQSGGQQQGQREGSTEQAQGQAEGQGQAQGQGEGREQGQKQGQGPGEGQKQAAQQGGSGDKEGHGAGGKKAADSAPIRNAGDAAKEQAGIRNKLGDVVREISNAMPDVPGNFSNADQSMKGSHGSLQKGDTRGSAPQQKQALDELQSAQDALLQQLADSMRDVMLTFGPPGTEGGGGGTCDRTDPFGRCIDGKNTEDIGIPDEKERRRVQQIQEELRSRSNDYERPKVEREYIDRLLDQFE